MSKDDLGLNKAFWAPPTEAQLIVLKNSYWGNPSKSPPWDFTSEKDARAAAGHTYTVKTVGGPTPWGGAGGVAYQLIHNDTGHRYCDKFVQPLRVETGHRNINLLPDYLKKKVDGFTIESKKVLRLAVRIAETCVFDFLHPCVTQKSKVKYAPKSSHVQNLP